ncbi:MAG: hypothetical protein ACD_83C00278G0003 [uncultured bacterium]|uniref:Uncharacterized protein n=1 Tax=Berkelbacteria bacterium GW2011_GWA2_38_9 TaxID=1618334 RepID=A0A0G0PDR7_9BACT|nr:MAG: hypothetical protein ACD_83C00278G0003 [uncultured bacterium]KKQ87431.1 MAG: hypothetical protein UT11_C0053G0008 [Berkelbacteria bacterium GW2011_GWA2_38_9]
MATKKISTKRSTSVKKTSKAATKKLTTPEEKIDTRVKIQGQSLSVMRDMAPAKLEGLTEKTPEIIEDQAAQAPIEAIAPAEIKISEGQAKQVSEEDGAQTISKPTIAKEISIIAKDRTKELVAQEQASQSATPEEPEEDYSPEVLSDLSHENKIKKQAPVIWIIVLVVIIVALIGLIINWYFNQYGSTAKNETNSKVLSASVENTQTPPANDPAPKAVGEIDQKFNELNKLTNELDTDNLTREPSISVNVSE